MTVETLNITSGPYVGTNLLDTYEYDFRITDESELLVYETDDLGVQTTLVLNTDYTVTGVGVDGGGTVVRTAGNLPTDYIWYVRSNYAETQLTAFGSQGAFFPGIHEDAFDLVTFLIQQLRDEFTRTFRLADSIDIDGDFSLLNDAADRAGQYLAFGPTGDLVIASGTGADAGLRADLASLLVSQGASLVGVNDVAGNFTGDDVEAVLTEIYNLFALDPANIAANTANIATNTASIATLQSNTAINWARARQVGNDLNIVGLDTVTITSLNSTDIAFFDIGNDDLRTYRFDGTDWAQVGNDLIITVGVGTPSITALSSTRIAFIDGANDELRTYDFDGTDWAQVGNSLAIASIGIPSITALSSTRIAFFDSINDDLRTYEFDGTDWAQVGNDLNIPVGSSAPAITSLNSTDIAFLDTSNDDLRTYRFDGTDWAQVGNDLNITDGVFLCALTTLNSTDISTIITPAAGPSKMAVYRFDGTDWAQTGDYLAPGSAAGYRIAALNGIDIAYIDTTNSDLRVYQHSYYLGDGPYRP